MEFNRLVLDLLHFIRCLLWSEKGRAVQPFRAIHRYRCDRGILEHIEGRNTLKACDTWRFCPRSAESEYLVRQARAPDTHIYLDWHDALTITPDGERPVRFYLKQPTHTIYIFNASHYPNEKGHFQASLVTHQDFNFAQGAEQSFEAIERKARRAAKMAAVLVATYSLERYHWPEEFAHIHYKVCRTGKPWMGTYAYKQFGS